MSKVNKSLQQEIDELDKLVVWFERSDIDLDEALEKFEEGAERVKAIQERLNSLENKIEILKQKFDK